MVIVFEFQRMFGILGTYYCFTHSKREPWPMAPIEYSGYYADGFPKRNFDEIDR